MTFVLDDPPYNVRTDQDVDHAERDLFGLNDMKEAAKVLGEFM